MAQQLKEAMARLSKNMPKGGPGMPSGGGGGGAAKAAASAATQTIAWSGGGSSRPRSRELSLPLFQRTHSALTL